MSRDIRRVPLDFDWPLHEKWKGYLSPDELDEIPCEPCDGRGYSPTALVLFEMWYGHLAQGRFRPEDNGSTPFLPTHPVIWARAERNIQEAPGYYVGGHMPVRYDDPRQDDEDVQRALAARDSGYTADQIRAATTREARRLAAHYNEGWCHHLNADDVEALLAADRLWDFTRAWSREHGWQRVLGGRAPTPQEVNEWSLAGMGHDSLNCGIVIEAKCRRNGVDPICALCNGHGSHEAYPGQRKDAENWERTDPPTGEGWQAWESVSEGSPISPVFATAEELAAWWSNPDRTDRWKKDWMPYDHALKLVKAGWAPSGATIGGEFVPGVEVAGRMADA